MFEKIKDKFFNKKFLTFCFIGVINTLLAQVIYIVLVGNDLL